MFRAAALKFLALLGAAAFIAGASPKVHADVATWLAEDGVQSAVLCSMFGNGDAFCDGQEIRDATVGDQSLPAHFCYTNGVNAFDISEFAAFSHGQGTALTGASGSIMYYVHADHASCFAAFNANATQTMGLYQMSFHCGNNRVSDPSTCEAQVSGCQGGLHAALELKITGSNPASSEYVATCLAGCEYEISNASIFKDSETGQFYMKGQYTSVGATCTPGIDTTQGDEVQDPDTGFEDVSGGNSTTAPSGDGCADITDMLCHHEKQIAAQDDLHAVVNSGGEPVGVLGGPLQFPALPWMVVEGERVCKIQLDLPTSGHFIALRTWLGSFLEIDLCSYTGKIDSIGGFLLYFATALALWGLFMRAPGS